MGGQSRPGLSLVLLHYPQDPAIFSWATGEILPLRVTRLLIGQSGDCSRDTVFPGILVAMV